MLEKGPIRQAKQDAPDYRKLIPAARTGDPEALGEFVTLTDASVRRKTTAIANQLGSGTADDVHATAMGRLLSTGLRRFDPDRPLPEGTHSEDEARRVVSGRWNRYVNLAVRTSLIDLLRRRRKEEITNVGDDDMARQIDSTTSSPIFNHDVTGSLPDLEKLLSPNQYRAVMLRIDGMANADIAKEFGIEYDAAKALLHRARQKIEGKFLTPAGLKRIRAFDSRKGFIEAVYDGKIQSVIILGYYYTTAEWAAAYIPQQLRRQIKEDQTEEA